MHWKTARAHTTLTSRYLAVNSAGPAATTWFPGQVRIETEKRRHGAHGSRTADVYWWRRTRKSFSSIRARTRERDRAAWCVKIACVYVSAQFPWSIHDELRTVVQHTERVPNDRCDMRPMLRVLASARVFPRRKWLYECFLWYSQVCASQRSNIRSLRDVFSDTKALRRTLNASLNVRIYKHFHISTHTIMLGAEIISCLLGGRCCAWFAWCVSNMLSVYTSPYALVV